MWIQNCLLKIVTVEIRGQISPTCATRSANYSEDRCLLIIVPLLVYLQASGVQVSPECKDAFNDIKLRHQYRYAIFALTGDLTRIVILKLAPPGECFAVNIYIYIYMQLIHARG